MLPEIVLAIPSPVPTADNTPMVVSEPPKPRMPAVAAVPADAAEPTRAVPRIDAVAAIRSPLS